MMMTGSSINITTINALNTTSSVSQTWHTDREKQGYNVGNIKIPAYIVNAHYFKYLKFL